jgi:hypothetical protein
MVDAEGPDFWPELARFRKVNGLVHRFSTPRNGYLALNLIECYSRLRMVTR